MNERIKLLVEQDGFQCIKDKALRLALGALQRFIKYDYNENPFDGKDVEGVEAITAIKEALAQPAAQAERKPLSDEEIYSLADSLEIWKEDDEEWILDPNTFARAIEAAHGIGGEA